MKKYQLGEFEEVVLLTIGILARLVSIHFFGHRLLLNRASIAHEKPAHLTLCKKTKFLILVSGLSIYIG